ncbi:DNA replication/repair protein RecF [Selenomonas sp. TAMA-11512]|uniref:DNA replication/repair protein RecF n=1 Tax=Selenomonas sp. TAMA-11512 TaxID=3095337 RepID=UPI00308F6837|nr:DNA replication/repair protein RecF [Selenomonas sp. TAMA-11512]
MKFECIALRSFRNYEELRLSFSPGINVFLGENAQGKTNIIEAVQYASLGRSHRTRDDNDLVRWEEKEARVSLSFSRRDVSHQLEFLFARKKRRRIFHNGAEIKTGALVGVAPSVLFSPEDLFLIKGAPQLRRHYLDAELSSASPVYYRELLNYHHLLTQRNALLKELRDHEGDESLLEFWDMQISSSAAKIVERRIQAVAKLSDIAGRVQREISTQREALEIRYELHGRRDEKDVDRIHRGEVLSDSIALWYNKRLAERRSLDILRGFTSVGPQRDDIDMRINGVSMKSFGSQGQQRTGALSLKLSELVFLKEETGEYPVLLLDDVMSELDAGRRTALLDYIRRESVQTLITATDAAYFADLDPHKVFCVKAGRVMEEHA